MPSSITLQQIKWDFFFRKVLNKSKKIKNQRKSLLARLAVLGFKDIQEHFKEEKGPDGLWKKLSAAAIARRKGGGGGAKILQDTGRLRNSLTPSIGKRFFLKDQVTIFTPLDYAETHNKGKGRIPQRKFMYISKGGMEKIKEQVEKFIGF